jgi:hypothetical protein
MVFFVQNGLKKYFSYIFWGTLKCNHVARTTQGLKDKVPRKKYVVSIEFSLFSFIFYFFIHVLHDVIFNVTTLI